MTRNINLNGQQLFGGLVFALCMLFSANSNAWGCWGWHCGWHHWEPRPVFFGPPPPPPRVIFRHCELVGGNYWRPPHRVCW